MVTEKVIVKDKVGLHARTAAILAKAASKFESDIEVVHQGKKANGKSMLSLMALGVKSGNEIELTAKGKDQKEAITALIDLVIADFESV